MPSFSERLKLALDLAGKPSASVIGKRSGLAQTTISAYLRGDSFPGIDKIEALAASVGVRPEWLATGEEPMKAGEKPTTISEKPEGYLVPMLDVEASAGYGNLDQQELVVEHVAFRPEWLRNELGVNLQSIVLIRARGDSMEPNIRDGDLLLIDHNQIHDRTDAIYLVLLEGRLMVKRVQFLLKGKVKLISDNSAYEPLMVNLADLDDFRLVGRVVWSGSRM